MSYTFSASSRKSKQAVYNKQFILQIPVFGPLIAAFFRRSGSYYGLWSILGLFISAIVFTSGANFVYGNSEDEVTHLFFALHVLIFVIAVIITIIKSLLRFTTGEIIGKSWPP